MLASSYTTLFNFSSVGLVRPPSVRESIYPLQCIHLSLVVVSFVIYTLQLPSSLISESVTLLNGGKLNPVGALSRAARYLHTTRQIESTSVATLPVKTKVRVI